MRRSKGQRRGCPFCKEEFFSKRDLTTHLAEVHGSVQQFKCHICGKVLKKKQNLEVHIAGHSGNEAFQCNICQKKFAHKRYYVAHMNTHAGYKAFQCKQCLKPFTFASQLTKHKKECSATPLF